MCEDSIGLRGDRIAFERKRKSPQGRRVRLGLLSWPALTLMGVVGAAVAFLLGVGTGDGWEHPPAKKTVFGNSCVIKAIQFRPDGTMLSSVGVDGSIAILDLGMYPEDPYLPPHRGPVSRAAFSPDNRVLAMVTSTAEVTVHDLVDHRSWTLDDTPALPTGDGSLAFSPDGTTLALGQPGGNITLWNLSTRRIRSTLQGHTGFVVSLAFAPDGATLASSGHDRVGRIWDLTTSRERFVTTCRLGAFVGLTFSLDGRLLCMGDLTSPVVRVWDMTTGVERTPLDGPEGAVVSVGISPDGTTLAAADYKGTVTFWDFATLAILPRRLRRRRLLASVRTRRSCFSHWRLRRYHPSLGVSHWDGLPAQSNRGAW